MKDIGFKNVNVTTPKRKLDLDILENNEQYISDRFWKTFLKIANEKDKDNWQKFISNSNWSSHMMVIIKKS